MKLLVLHNDSVAIWDAKECEIINELRTSKDLVKRGFINDVTCLIFYVGTR